MYLYEEYESEVTHFRQRLALNEWDRLRTAGELAMLGMTIVDKIVYV